VKFRIALVPFLLLAAAFAQMPSKPGAEVKKLDYFVGTWTTEGTVAQGPWGPGGKFTSTITNEWMAGNSFLVGRSDFKMPPEIGGEGTAISYKGYDRKRMYIPLQNSTVRDDERSRRVRSAAIRGRGTVRKCIPGRTSSRE
jgi:hypothetical protein